MTTNNNCENNGENESMENALLKDVSLEDVSLDEFSLEDMLAEVERCIEQLENPQISLEDSFRYYEEGVRRLRLCSRKTAQIEQKMLMINSEGELEDF